MDRRLIILFALTLSSLYIPVVAGNMPVRDIILDYRIKGNGVDVSEGYWVYGTIHNTFMIQKSMSDIVLEITLLDINGAELDVITTTVNQTLVGPNEKGSFLAKSTTQEEVANIMYKMVSFEETPDINFKYLELSTIWTVETGVTGWLENIHDFIYVYEAEVIATFFDAEGNVVDIDSYMMNYGSKFDVGEKKKWFIETEMTFDSYLLSVQCDMRSRERYLRLDIDRPNKVNNTWTPPIGETIILVLKDEPHFGTDYVEAVITDPYGESTIRQFTRSGLLDYRYEITPDIPGVWNVTWVTEPFFVSGGVWAEGTQLDSRFFTWDPNPEEELPVETATNSTLPDVIVSPDTVTTLDSESITSSASDIIDSATEEIMERLPESVKQQIPGFPVTSIAAAFVVVYVLALMKKYVKTGQRAWGDI